MTSVRLTTRLLVVVAALATVAPSAARASNRGVDFWGCDMGNALEHARPPLVYIVANPGATPTTVTVESPDGGSQTAVVPPGAQHEFSYPRDYMMLGTSRQPWGYHITSDAPIVAYQFNPLANAFTNDTSTLLPLDALGTSYRAMTTIELLGGPPLGSLVGEVAIVGTSVQPTTVTITPRGRTRAGFIPATAAGVPVSFTLARGEVAQVVSGQLGSELTGSLIESDRPVAVFSGSLCSFVPPNVNYCDHIEEQLYPTTAWGTDFLCVKSYVRGFEPDYWRIVAHEDDTVVTLEPDPTGDSPLTLQAGAFREFFTRDDVHLTSSRPVEVGQYFPGHLINIDPFLFPTGDPSLILVTPTQQFLSSYPFLTPDSYIEDYITIVAPDGATATLDGSIVPAGEFLPIGSTGFMRARLRVPDGPHELTCSASCGLYVYGWDTDTSYGYPGGAATEDIAAPVACDAGGPYGLDCGLTVPIDGSHSAGPPALSYLWSALTPGVTFADESAAITTATVPGPGDYTVALTVTSDSGSATCTTTIAPDGVGPPPSLEPNDALLACLWPPNHRMWCFTPDDVAFEVLGGCGALRLEFVDCTSNQPDDDRGDGNTTRDCTVEPDRICARAERQGRIRADRVYTVHAVVIDELGRASDPQPVATIRVPHDSRPRLRCPRLRR